MRPTPEYGFEKIFSLRSEVSLASVLEQVSRQSTQRRLAGWWAGVVVGEPIPIITYNERKRKSPDMWLLKQS